MKPLDFRFSSRYIERTSDIKVSPYKCPVFYCNTYVVFLLVVVNPLNVVKNGLLIIKLVENRKKNWYREKVLINPFSTHVSLM